MVTKNAVFMRAVAFRKRLIVDFYVRSLAVARIAQLGFRDEDVF